MVKSRTTSRRPICLFVRKHCVGRRITREISKRFKLGPANPRSGSFRRCWYAPTCSFRYTWELLKSTRAIILNLDDTLIDSSAADDYALITTAKVLVSDFSCTETQADSAGLPFNARSRDHQSRFALTQVRRLHAGHRWAIYRKYRIESR